MSLFDKVKENYSKVRVEALKGSTKAQIERGILSTLIGELMPSGNEDKEVSDLKVMSLVKKYMDKIDETLEDAVNEQYRHKLIIEKNTLNRYAPKQFSKEETQELVDKLVEQHELDTSNKKNFGFIMKTMNETYGAKIDNNELKDIVNGIFNG